MGKKVREYKSGDFIFAKVKGYPAWPARVQKHNGKRYFVYFYGTGETANLPPNMIFDYAENKDKFLTKTVKRRDFNDGVKQIEHDFANNVPLEQVIGIPAEDQPADTTANDTVNESTNDTMDETADPTAADETMADDTTLNATQNDTAVEDSDEAGNLVIDEGKQKPRKSKDVKAKETPAKPGKEPKTPRGKAKKEEAAKDEDEEKKEEEIVSRSGRKIRPKRYIDEQTEDNATLPSPAPKKRRGGSPTPDKEKEKADPKDKPADKNIKQFNAVTQSELEDLKEPFKSEDTEKENILIAYLPTGQYIGIKLFQSRPNSFKSEASRLQWDKQAASNAITLKMQLEKGQITVTSILSQLVTDLNLTDEEKATLDKERETEEKKSHVQFLKTEMKLIELDAKIKTCLCLEKADTEMCLKLLDELMELQVRPLMLLKHPTCLETIKRMRAYVGNTPSWELSESAALVFSRQAHRIRKQADALYKNMKELFTTPDGLSFWEYFTERVLQFKKVTSKLSANELLEMIHEPIEMSVPTSHTMKSAVEAASADGKEDQPEEEDTAQKKKNTTPAKSKKEKVANNTPSKQPVKRQSSRKLQQEEKDKEKEESPKPTEETTPETNEPEQTPETVTENVENEQTTPEVTEEPKEDSPVEENKESKESKEENGQTESVQEESEKEEKKEEVAEPRAKRSRESKKTEPPPRSPAKRKSKC